MEIRDAAPVIIIDSEGGAKQTGYFTRWNRSYLYKGGEVKKEKEKGERVGYVAFK